jgi:hypothetical protein
MFNLWGNLPACPSSILFLHFKNSECTNNAKSTCHRIVRIYSWFTQWGPSAKSGNHGGRCTTVHISPLADTTITNEKLSCYYSQFKKGSFNSQWTVKRTFTIVLSGTIHHATFELLPLVWCLYVPPALPISNSPFCIYGSCMILTVNSDYFLKQR